MKYGRAKTISGGKLPFGSPGGSCDAFENEYKIKKEKER